MRALHRQENPGVPHQLQRIRPELLWGDRLAETPPNPDFALDASWEEVEDQEFEEIDRLWAALLAPDPSLLNRLLREATLPHIQRAAQRLAERELPWRVFERDSSTLSLSAAGRAVLTGSPAFDHLSYARWVGGIRLKGPQGLWVQGPDGHIHAR